MELEIKRIGADTFRIQGEIKIEFSIVEKLLKSIEALHKNLSEHKSFSCFYHSIQPRTTSGMSVNLVLSLQLHRKSNPLYIELFLFPQMGFSENEVLLRCPFSHYMKYWTAE